MDFEIVVLGLRRSLVLHYPCQVVGMTLIGIVWFFCAVALSVAGFVLWTGLGAGLGQLVSKGNECEEGWCIGLGVLFGVVGALLDMYLLFQLTVWLGFTRDQVPHL